MANKDEVQVSEATNITVRDFLTQYEDVAVEGDTLVFTNTIGGPFFARYAAFLQEAP
jgi:hypothetical protein